MNDYRVIETLRNMEWERVKGSLNAIVASIWDDEYEKKKWRDKVEKFIKSIDDGHPLELDLQEDD